MKRITLMLPLIVVVAFAFAQTPKPQKLNLDSHRLALDGYDPVSYFREEKAVEGEKSITCEYQNAVYRFSSDQNRKTFLATPTMYLPQYGGWCAYAMGATGERVEVDPETFKIIDGKLYLFYNKFFNNTLESWNKDEHTLKAKADANWKSLNK